MPVPADPRALVPALRALALTARVEWALRLVVVGGVVGLATRALRRRGEPAAPAARTRGARELGAVAVVLAVGLALRTVDLAGATQPRFSFSETAVVAVGSGLRMEGYWPTVRTRLPNLRVVVVEDSPLLVAVHGLFDRLLGPSIELPGQVGAAWGAAAILLAWLLGRATVSPGFGLAFAGLVAVSPLQVQWSRLGGVPTAAVTHTLLALLVGWIAGARRSLALAATAGVVAFASFYHYYAARAAIPLALVAMLDGARRRRTPGGRPAWLLVAVAAATLVACVELASSEGLAAFWPRYPGYVGSKGERSAVELVANACAAVAAEARPALAAYFWRSRAYDPLFTWRHGPPVVGDALTPGMQYGGLCLVPLALLGALGLVRCLARPVDRVVWLALAAFGLALPALSLATARRLLTLDLAWCALAAHGLVWAARRASPARATLAAVVLGALALWSGLALGLVDRTLPVAAGTPIPFGESGFGDGLTCLGCVADGRRWQRTIAAGAAVVLFDGDREREGPTSPAGLLTYGEIAALAAGRPSGFVEFYHALEQTRVRELTARLARLDAAGIVWEFRHPSEWERALADRLRAAGGAEVALRLAPLVAPWSTPRPLGGLPQAFQVVTPGVSRGAALAAVDAFLGPRAALPPCAWPRAVGTYGVDAPVLTALGPTTAPSRHVGRWASGSYRFVAAGRRRIAADGAVAMGAVPGGVRILERGGGEIDVLPNGASLRRPGRGGAPVVGRGCAALAGGRWWVVDPLAGTVAGAPGDPRGRWVGIAASGGVVVLASAEQEVALLDAASGAVRGRFPARVSAPWIHRLGDCSPVAVGDGWVATLSPYDAGLALYGFDGAPLADVGLARYTAVDDAGITSIAAGGPFLEVAQPGSVQLFELERGCGR